MLSVYFGEIYLVRAIYLRERRNASAQYEYTDLVPNRKALFVKNK